MKPESCFDAIPFLTQFPSNVAKLEKALKLVSYYIETCLVIILAISACACMTTSFHVGCGLSFRVSRPGWRLSLRVSRPGWRLSLSVSGPVWRLSLSVSRPCWSAVSPCLPARLAAVSQCLPARLAAVSQCLPTRLAAVSLCLLARLSRRWSLSCVSPDLINRRSAAVRSAGCYRRPSP